MQFMWLIVETCKLSFDFLVLETLNPQSFRRLDHFKNPNSYNKYLIYLLSVIILNKNLKKKMKCSNMYLKSESLLVS